MNNGKFSSKMMTANRIILLISFLLVNLNSVRGQSEDESELIASGFLLGRVANRDKIALRVITTNNMAVSLQSFQLANVPAAANIKTKIFHLVPDLMAGGRNVWSNGVNYCFFIVNPADSKAPYGTWLIGQHVGVDAGVAYFKPNRPSMSPLLDEIDGPKWHYLLGKDWVEDRSIQVVNIGEDPLLYLRFSKVEYADDDQMTTSFVLLTDPYNLGFDKQSLGAILASLMDHDEVPPPSPGTDYPILWDEQTASWKDLVVLQTIPFGVPRVLSTSARNGRTEAVVHLVNAEYLNFNWRLSFRLTNNGDEIEKMIMLDNNFLSDEYYIAGAIDFKTRKSNDLMQVYQKNLQASIGNIKVGQYAWLWYQSSLFLGRGCHGTVCDNNLILKCITAMNSSWSGVQDKSPYHSDILIFQYFEADRRDTMARSALSISTSYIIATWNRTLNQYEIKIEDIPLVVHTVFVIGEPIKWIADHLTTHERVLTPSLSSCFFYHSGVTLPQQFIYAAEVICVLMGAKPVAMVSTELLPNSL
jgi:hypothetical protein